MQLQQRSQYMSKTRGSLKAVQLKHESTEEEEDDEDQQQQRSRRTMHTVGETGSGSGVPAFLAKLWRLVDDPDTNNLICWSKVGRHIVYLHLILFSFGMATITITLTTVTVFLSLSVHPHDSLESEKECEYIKNRNKEKYTELNICL